MAAAKPTPWDDDQKQKVRNLLTKFCGDKETICAVMECRQGDLNWLCRNAFGLTYAQAKEKFELEGKAKLRMAYYDAAIGGKNAKALEIVTREHLGIPGPVERRHKVLAEEEAKAKEVDF